MQLNLRKLKLSSSNKTKIWLSTTHLSKWTGGKKGHSLLVNIVNAYNKENNIQQLHDTIHSCREQYSIRIIFNPQCLCSLIVFVKLKDTGQPQSNWSLLYVCQNCWHLVHLEDLELTNWWALRLRIIRHLTNKLSFHTGSLLSQLLSAFIAHLSTKSNID